MPNVETLDEAIDFLEESGEFLTKAEDLLYEKINKRAKRKKATSLIETAYLEIDEVLGYLKKLKKEKK